MGTDEAWRPVYKAPFIRTFRPPSTGLQPERCLARVDR